MRTHEAIRNGLRVGCGFLEAGTEESTGDSTDVPVIVRMSTGVLLGVVRGVLLGVVRGYYWE